MVEEVLIDVIKNLSKYLAFKNKKYLITASALFEIVRKKIEKDIEKWWENSKKKARIFDVKEGYNIWSESYEENPLLKVNGRILKRIIPRKLKGKRILDIGCGTGIWAEYFYRKGAEVYGIDISEKMLEMARKRVPKGKFYLGDVTKIPFQNEFFDIVFCSLVLSHVKDLKKAIREIHRVLEKNGILIISDMHPEVTRKGYIIAWKIEINIKVYHRTFSEILGTIWKYFKIERFEEYGIKDFEETENWSKENSSLLYIIKARKT